MLTPSPATSASEAQSALVSRLKARGGRTVDANTLRSRALSAPFGTDLSAFRYLSHRIWTNENTVTCRNAFVEVGGIEPAAIQIR